MQYWSSFVSYVTMVTSCTCFFMCRDDLSHAAVITRTMSNIAFAIFYPDMQVMRMYFMRYRDFKQYVPARLLSYNAWDLN